MIEKFIISLTKKSEKKLDKLILENCPPSLSLSRTKQKTIVGGSKKITKRQKNTRKK